MVHVIFYNLGDKRFIHEDLEKKYERTTFKRIPDKIPENGLLYGEELERIDITSGPTASTRHNWATPEWTIHEWISGM